MATIARIRQAVRQLDAEAADAIPRPTLARFAAQFDAALEGSPQQKDVVDKILLEGRLQTSGPIPVRGHPHGIGPTAKRRDHHVVIHREMRDAISALGADEAALMTAAASGIDLDARDRLRAVLAQHEAAFEAADDPTAVARAAYAEFVGVAVPPTLRSVARGLSAEAAARIDATEEMLDMDEYDRYQVRTAF
jgi:hypothetical protein